METKDPALTKTPITETDRQTGSDEKDMTLAHPKHHEALEENTTVNKGTDTFEEEVVDSEHVNDDDNPARQPDRRDQGGTAFDDNVNEHTIDSDSPDSQKIHNKNRYANIDNAQTRALNPYEKDEYNDKPLS